MSEYIGVSRQLVSHEDAQALGIEKSIEDYLRPKWPWPSLDSFNMGFTPGRLANLTGLHEGKYKVTQIHDEVMIEPIEG